MKTKKIKIIGKIVKDKKLENRVVYNCAKCGEGCNAVYYFNSRWFCWDCYQELKKSYPQP